jgi:hypothetical protein
MQFKFPKKSIGDRAWFLTNTDTLVFGKVSLITIAINEDECKVFYRFFDEQDNGYTVGEEQVLENQVNVPNPKYAIGDSIIYSDIVEGQQVQFVDTIKHVEIGVYEKGAVEICYVMEHNVDGWIMEEQVLSHREPSYEMSDDVPPFEDDDNTWNMLITGGSDV